MALSLLMDKLLLDADKFVTSEKIKEYCRGLGLSYGTAIDYYTRHKYLVRIFRGVFYLRSPDERRMGRDLYSPLQLVAKGLELKNVDNWYFGLYSALKLNNMTHEYFSIDEVINDKISRPKPFKVNGYRFRFRKVKSGLFGFGVTTGKNGIRYSDAEKTILDFVYLWRYNRVPEAKVVLDVSEWAEGVSETRLREYVKHYPKTVERTVEKVLT